ncbi:methyltransferase domain-containing protein [Candidatus Collierbacteria bacterium]|nr:methyltransferase domain-containing protein [Candidatus Collierbacteria bacterium]
MNLKNILFATLRRRLVDGDLFAQQHLFAGRVLDLGGGRTRGEFPHGRELDWTVLDIDFNLKPTLIGDAQVLPFRDSSFDSIKCSELTGYLFEPLKMLTEVKRVLRPGGVAVFTSPFLTPFDFDQHDSIRLTSAWWVWAAGKAGLTIEKLEPQGYFFSVLGDAEKYWISHWWPPLRYLGYLIMFPVYELLFWWETRFKSPNYLKRFTTGFLLVLKKDRQ